MSGVPSKDKVIEFLEMAIANCDGGLGYAAGTRDFFEGLLDYVRNSMPKQALRSAYEEGWYDGAISVSGQRMTALHDVLLSEYWAASDARTALGITEDNA